MRGRRRQNDPFSIEAYTHSNDLYGSNLRRGHPNGRNTREFKLQRLVTTIETTSGTRVPNTRLPTSARPYSNACAISNVCAPEQSNQYSLPMRGADRDMHFTVCIR